MSLRVLRCAVVAVASLPMVWAPALGQSFPAAPSPEVVAEVRAAFATMRDDERGPYLRIRWFCADGSVHPPQGTPCLERGRGVQHAEHGPLARRLATLGYHVGTILQATDYAAFADEAQAGFRLRELVLQRFLVDVDDGWIMRRARYYRGALQIEDEEKAGRALLDRRFGDTNWVRANYLLATRLSASIPHTRIGTDRTMDRIRSTATEIANLDSGFMRIRVKIHSLPGPDDAGAVRAYLARGGHSTEVGGKLTQLSDDLARQYDPEYALASLNEYQRRLGGDLGAGLASLAEALRSGDPSRAFAQIAALATAIRHEAENSAQGARVVDLLDLGLSLQERAFVLAEELERTAPVASRADALRRLDQYVVLAYAGGYLSGRERSALHDQVSGMLERGTTTALAYKGDLGYLSRSLDWARGSVRGTFLPVLDRYVPVVPAAAGLPDALLRGSVLLPLSRVLDGLQGDADAVLGESHSIFGMTVAGGVRGLNPGVALRPIRVLEPGHEDEVDARTIYVLPETPTELKPVAGVLTMDEGNLLSHVQLLARNLGIPNARLSPDHLPRFLEASGREVFYAVSPLGRVVISWPDQLTPEEKALVSAGQPTTVERHRLDTSRLRLDVRQPIPLSELRSSASGVIVGPKAANLGQLAADYPGRVSAAVALPFGMFFAHADRPWNGSENTVLGEIRAAYGEANRMRAAGRSDPEVNAFMFQRLAWVREAIEGLDWLPEMEAQVVSALMNILDGDVSRGVFVRSDTNVEDLPQFSGAGLNLTVAHQTTTEEVLRSVKRVWTSPFSERAYLWRSQILEEQGDVYPSVLLQETVASAKSGVLITSGLQEGSPTDLTVVAAEGVGGAVDGEDAETLILSLDGTSRLLSQAKSPRRRQVVPGGTRWISAERPDTLLQPAELDQLLAVVSTLRASKAGTAEESTTWDIEYGFLEGRLWLFQIRPFIRYRNSDVYARLELLDAGALENADRPVSLAAPLGGSR